MGLCIRDLKAALSLGSCVTLELPFLQVLAKGDDNHNNV